MIVKLNPVRNSRGVLIFPRELLQAVTYTAEQRGIISNGIKLKSNMSEHTPSDYNQITEHIWIGNNMCCSMHAGKLLKLGFDADINLEEARPEAPPATKIYLWLPTQDHTPPTQDQLHSGVAAIRELANRNLKIYVHCRNGHGRAPTLVAAYLMTRGKSVEEALEFIKSKRPKIHLQDSQVEALNAFV